MACQIKADSPVYLKHAKIQIKITYVFIKNFIIPTKRIFLKKE